MATCLAVIKRAYRMLGVLAAGREPSSADAVDGLEALVGLYQSLISDGSLGRLTPVLITAAYTAKENERISGNFTVTLPTTITPTDIDQSPTAGDDPTAPRAPLDRAVVVVAKASPTFNIYQANLGAWVDIGALALADAAPLSVNMPEGLSARLALTLSAEQGVPVPPPVALAAARFMTSITSRPAELRDDVAAVYY